MALDAVNAVASVATLLVLAASVLAAVVQLGHMRASNELEAVLAVEHDFRSRELQSALNYVQTELPARLHDAGYRAELGATGYVDPRAHPEMVLCNWFNRTGALVRGGFLKEELFLDSFGRLVEHYWHQLSPVVALLRRTRGPGQYQSFEYLAYRAQTRRARQKQRDRYPRNARRLSITDPWISSGRVDDAGDQERSPRA